MHHVDITDFELLGDRQTFDLEAAGVVVEPIGTAGDEYRLSGFGGLLTRSGSYELRFAGGYDITDVTGNRSNRPSSTFEIAAPLTLTIDPLGFRTSPVESMVLRFSEPVTGFDIGGVTMWRDGSPVDLSGVVVVAQPGSQVFEVRGLHAATSVSGRYQLLVDPGGQPIVTQFGAMLEMPVMSDVFEVVIELDPTTTVPDESTTTSTTTLPDESTISTTTTSTTTLPDEPTTSTTTTSTTTSPDESTTSTTTSTLPDEPTTVPAESTTTTSTTSTTTTPMTTTTSTTTLPAASSTTIPPTLPPRSPGGTPGAARPTPTGPVVTPTNPTPTRPSRPLPVATTPSAPVRPPNRPVPRPLPLADVAEHDAGTSRTRRSIPIAVVTTSTLAPGPGEAPSGSSDPGSQAAAATGPVATSAASDTSSRLAIGAEWSALAAAIVAALVGLWFAFRDRGPAARYGDIST